MVFTRESAILANASRWNERNWRKERALSERTLENLPARVCVHEIGHTLCHWFVADAERFTDCTILPTDQFDGATFSEEKAQYTLSELKARLVVLFGGKIAELEFFSTAVGIDSDQQDLMEDVEKIVERKTKLRTRLQHRNARERLLEDAEAAAREVLCRRRPLIKKCALELFLRKTLLYADIRRLVGEDPVGPSTPPRTRRRRRRRRSNSVDEFFEIERGGVEYFRHSEYTHSSEFAEASGHSADFFANYERRVAETVLNVLQKYDDVPDSENVCEELMGDDYLLAIVKLEVPSTEEKQFAIVPMPEYMPLMSRPETPLLVMILDGLELVLNTFIGVRAGLKLDGLLKLIKPNFADWITKSEFSRAQLISSTFNVRAEELMKSRKLEQEHNKEDEHCGGIEVEEFELIDMTELVREDKESEHEAGGQCYCPRYVDGIACDRCVQYAFGYDALIGSQLCGCSINGSMKAEQRCDPLNGQCLCKENVGGRKCEHCLSAYDSFPECDCEQSGTLMKSRKLEQEQSLEEQIKADGRAELRCPVCFARIPLDVLPRFLSRPVANTFALLYFVRHNSPPSVLRRLAQCHGCSGLLLDAGDKLRTHSKIILCSRCSLLLCCHCDSLPHWPLSCAQNVQWIQKFAQHERSQELSEAKNGAIAAQFAQIFSEARARRIDLMLGWQLGKHTRRLLGDSKCEHCLSAYDSFPECDCEQSGTLMKSRKLEQEQSLEEQIKADGRAELRCPVCFARIPLDVLPRFLSRPVANTFALLYFVRHNSPPSVLRRLAQCHGCSGLLLDAGDKLRTHSKIILCSRCSLLLCCHCDSLPHWPLSCAQNVQWIQKFAQHERSQELSEAKNGAIAAQFAQIFSEARARRIDLMLGCQLGKHTRRLLGDSKSERRFVGARKTLCGCSINGSMKAEQRCDPLNGQCLCKENVGGRKCEHCLSAYDSFPECDCEQSGTLMKSRKLEQEQSLEEQIKADGRAELRCPVCFARIPLDVLPRFLSRPVANTFALLYFVRHNSPPSVLRRLAQCHGCSGLLLDAGDKLRTHSKIILCSRCSLLLCCHCDSLPHWPLSCAQNVQWIQKFAQHERSQELSEAKNGAIAAQFAQIFSEARARRIDLMLGCQLGKHTRRLLGDSKSERRFVGARKTENNGKPRQHKRIPALLSEVQAEHALTRETVKEMVQEAIEALKAKLVPKMEAIAESVVRIADALEEAEARGVFEKMSLEDGPEPEGELPQEEERDIEQPPNEGQREELAMAAMPARIIVSAEAIEVILGAMPTTTIMVAEGTTTGIAEGTETSSRRRRPDASITCAVAEIVPDRQRRGERVIVSSALGTVVSVLTVADRIWSISSRHNIYLSCLSPRPLAWSQLRSLLCALHDLTESLDNELLFSGPLCDVHGLNDRLVNEASLLGEVSQIDAMMTDWVATVFCWWGNIHLDQLQDSPSTVLLKKLFPLSLDTQDAKQHVYCPFTNSLKFR
ncbi:hypothetical protein GPALN_013216 [Globodera pallida]|nr:hypothetical protein GPALN_013216 [Globodera pallida]